MEDLVDSAYMITNASSLFTSSKGVVDNGTKVLNDINAAITNLEERIKEMDRELPDLRNVTDVADHHSSVLKNRVNNTMLHDAWIFL